MNILFFQTAHSHNDDRVKYHQWRSLEDAGHRCSFASTAAEIHDTPDVVICDNPIALWRARKALSSRVPIVYDVTEWYPSKKNLRSVSWWLKPGKRLVSLAANYWAGWSAKAFLFGEYHKARPFRLLFPWKRYIMLPYYPSLSYIPYTPPAALTHQVRLLYAGPQTAEKGYNRVQELVRLCETNIPNANIVLTTINNLSFKDFCEEITRHDIFLDLRDADAENTRCLPIKLFYYLAAGRPVIYSDLKAIRHGVPEIVNDSLVRPNDIERAAIMIRELISHPKQYASICKRNRELAEKQYNWELQKEDFIQFIESLKP